VGRQNIDTGLQRINPSALELPWATFESECTYVYPGRKVWHIALIKFATSFLLAEAEENAMQVN